MNKNYITKCGKLITYFSKYDVYKLNNTLKKITYSKEEFDQFEIIKHSDLEFRQAVNNYFKNVNHEWEYEGVKFKKLENFTGKGNSSYFGENYEGVEIPLHDFEKEKSNLNFFQNRKFSHQQKYFWGYCKGKIYKCCFNHNEGSATLYNPYDNSYQFSIGFRHIAPIYNMETKKII